jgi:ParB family chromosome partitioning protein
MTKRSGLGRGLDALIPGGGPSGPSGFVSSDGGVTQLSTESIQRNPRQPRLHFAESELQELAASIREHGIIRKIFPDRGRTSFAGCAQGGADQCASSDPPSE